MNALYAYHVVTDRPMQPGQRIVFDESNRSGVYRRVLEKLPIVEEIYAQPENYTAAALEHHTRVALRELALEEVRQKKYPHLPSRLGCLYVSETLEEAEIWAQSFINWGRPTYAIVKLKITGSVFAGDAHNCFDATVCKEENLRMAEDYWQNRPNRKNLPPVKEILAAGEIEVAAIVKEINKNL